MTTTEQIEHPMVPYTLQPATLSDRHSNTCLTRDRPDESGLQDFGVVIRVG